MKYIPFLAIICSFVSTYAQNQGAYTPNVIEIDPITKQYFTEGVVITVKPMTKELIMTAAYRWLADVKFANSLASKGIDLKETAFNRITVNQYFYASKEANNMKVRFLLTLDFRDGRFRYNFTDFNYYTNANKLSFEDADLTDPVRSKLMRNLAIETNEFIKTALNELIDYINQYQPENW